jgi:hypothetical protein
VDDDDTVLYEKSACFCDPPFHSDPAANQKVVHTPHGRSDTDDHGLIAPYIR